MSPLQYRQRFGRLARELQGLAGSDRGEPAQSSP